MSPWKSLNCENELINKSTHHKLINKLINNDALSLNIQVINFDFKKNYTV